MRLWHEKLISSLPRQQLLGLHRECCALRGLFWGRKHKVVEYVFRYNPGYLVAYHTKVMKEMQKRGYRVDEKWFDPLYRGKRCNPYQDPDLIITAKACPVYSEHDDAYLQECLDNLTKKGIEIQAQP